MLTTATAMPIASGAALAFGWIAMALVTLFFVVVALGQLVRRGNKVRP